MSAFLEGRYYVFAHETRTVFPGSWVFVADEHELPGPGDYLSTIVGTEPVVVLRDADRKLAAFLNVCPHRGSTLLRGSGTCDWLITCPLHGWRFGLDGTHRATTFSARMREAPEPGAMDLQPVRLERWRRFVFVTLSDTAPPLAEWLEDACALTATYPLETSVCSQRSYERQSLNWKVFWDINLDLYHIPTVHRGSVAGEFRILDSTLWTGPRTTSYAQMVLRRPLVSEDRVLPGLPAERRLGSFRVAVHPNFVATFEPDGHVFVSWVLPTGVNDCVIGALAYGPPDGDPELSRAELKEGLDLVMAVQHEDYVACRRNVVGLRSNGYRPGPAHDLEMQTEALHRWLREAYTWQGAR
jgi:nitrite reductase/ring-hydroxylating ferredoxin subunit